MPSDPKIVNPSDINMRKEMRHLIMRVVLLYKISREKTYAYALIKDLLRSRHFKHANIDAKVMKYEIYNALKALEKSGYIKPRSSAENGKLKIFYGITPKGRLALSDMSRIWKKTMAEVSKLLK
ncbi:MAG: PadR family transcriptional regulator [Candidatus Micrarchaeaceae archaeon]